MNKRTKKYSARHLICEACTRRPAGPAHHIKSRGAGGGDDVSNLLSLCGECHTRIHTEGEGRFVLHYPRLHRKIGAIKFKALQGDLF